MKPSCIAWRTTRCAIGTTMASLRPLAAGLLLAPLLLSPASAGELRTVEVNGIRNPELKPYRVMLAGLDAFDEYHALAPGAAGVRFKLRPRAGADDGVTLDNLTLRIAGNQTSVAVPLAADGQFTLPRSAALADEDADLVLNQRKGNYRWEVRVRSEGVPADMVRLGDMRLECEVMVAVVKKEMSFWVHAAVTSLAMTNHWCGWDKLDWQGRSTRALRSATLVTGDQRIALPLGDAGHLFVAPTSARRYPDDALIELAYEDKAPAPGP